MKIEHEITGNGTHRLIATLSNNIISSPFVGYQQIAGIKVGNSQYIAVTEYYRGSALEPETVYQVSKVNQ